MQTYLRYGIWFVMYLAAAGGIRSEGKIDSDESKRQELEMLRAEEIARDKATITIWSENLKKFGLPFNDAERRALGVRLTRLSKPHSFHVPKNRVNKLFESYRRKVISDSEYVDWCVSLIHEEKQSALATGQVLMFRQKAKFATNILSKIRADKSARALGALLADTRGSLREPPYTNQPEHDYWSLAGAAVSALHAMNLEDPPEVEDERSYRWPETLIAVWQEWWAGVERGEREIRFKEEGAATEKDATTASAGARQRPAPADRPGARGPSPDSVPPPDPSTWIGWAALGFLAGLVALYFGLRRPASGRLR